MTDNVDASESEDENDQIDILRTIPSEKSITARAGDRVSSFDVISKQIRMMELFYPKDKESPFELPVVYEDDHIAIVNKPAGVPVFSHRKGGHGSMTVRSALPYVLTKPRRGTLKGLRRAHPVHRIDLPTSGILICAKTKPALVTLNEMFVMREIKKDYTAVVSGAPSEYQTDDLAKVRNGDEGEWHTIDNDLDGKKAITHWKVRKIACPEKLNGNRIMLVDVKLETGRHHQIRRHFSSALNCPLLGDKRYDGGSEKAKSFRDLGLFLCASRVSFKHPYYNTDVGKKEWISGDCPGKDSPFIREDKASKNSDIDFEVVIDAKIELPKKYEDIFSEVVG